MNVTKKPSVNFERKTGAIRKRIVPSMNTFLDGLSSVKALAEAMDSFNKKTVGKGAASITPADLPRACGAFGTDISDSKMTAIIKYLTANRSHQFNAEKDVVQSDDFIRFHSDSLKLVVAARKNLSRKEFAAAIGATEEEIKHAETEKLVRSTLLPAYKKATAAIGATLLELK
jgi:hypothetical protein